jgi:hypothetical protein
MADVFLSLIFKVNGRFSDSYKYSFINSSIMKWNLLILKIKYYIHERKNRKRNRGINVLSKDINIKVIIDLKISLLQNDVELEEVVLEIDDLGQ